MTPLGASGSALSCAALQMLDSRSPCPHSTKTPEARLRCLAEGIRAGCSVCSSYARLPAAFAVGRCQC